MSGKRGKWKPWPANGPKVHLKQKKDAEQEILISVSNVASQLYPRLLGTRPHETLIDAGLVEKFPLFYGKYKSISVPGRANPGPYRK
jgi:hypothetical protein